MHVALSELHQMIDAHPEMDINDMAREVAGLVNDDMGGLHLPRTMYKSKMRNATVQHLMRLFLLAPDWTESNINTMAKGLIGNTKTQRALYHTFWARTITRGVTASVLMNSLMAVLSGLTGDEEDDMNLIEQYKRAWDEGSGVAGDGWKRVLDVDITPIYKALQSFRGAEDKGTRKYLSILGHFQDPIKFIKDPVKSAHHKGSILYSSIYEAMSGGDWQNHRFTTMGEFMGIDDKGHYEKTGLPKGGKSKGDLTSRQTAKGSLGVSQIPSYAAHRLRSILPIFVQENMKFVAGEADGWDTFMRSIGAHAKGGYTTDFEHVSDKLDKIGDEAKSPENFKNREEYHKFKRTHAKELRMDRYRVATAKQISMLTKALHRTTEEAKRTRIETKIQVAQSTFMKKYREVMK